MLDIDLVRKWDKKAMSLGERGPDKNIYEFDLSLWLLLAKLAACSPDATARQFSLNKQIVTLLAEVDESQLKRLASGVIISFKLETPEQLIFNELSIDYDPTIFVKNEINSFDAAYWLLINKVAKQNQSDNVTKEIFGISSKLVKSISLASDSQLLLLANNVITFFSLRFSSDLIEEILSFQSNKKDDVFLKKYQQLILKKYQQSISGRGRTTGGY